MSSKTSKRISVADPAKTCWKTDWEKCCLCQVEMRETLTCPPSRSKTENDGYKNIAINLPLFYELNEMPIAIDPQRLDEGDGIESTLRRNKALYHQTCRLKFNNTKLQRLQKKRKSLEEQSDDEATSSKFTRKSSTRKQSEKEPSTAECFLCERIVPKYELREAMTMKLNESLYECASLLQDQKLLAKLSAGDVVAQEMKYHSKCLTSLYNRKRAYTHATGQTLSADADSVALAELVTYINETYKSSEGATVFRLADLSELYTQRLNQLGSTDYVHVTRLKEKLISLIPGLESHQKGREIILTFKDDIGPAITQACEYSDDVFHIAKSVSTIRKDMLEKTSSFNGRLDKDDQERSIPASLLELVSMVVNGPDIKSQLENGATESDLAIAQLLQYNCRKSARKGIQTRVRHSKSRETPFAIYVALLIFSKTRKRQLIDKFHHYGICISYDRVLEISTLIGEAVVQQYEEDGIVCPPVLRKGLFTTAAVDNIDYNPSATTSKSSFHGTGISVFQHPSNENMGQEREFPPIAIAPKSKKIPPLPENYTNVRPAYFKSDPLPPSFPEFPQPDANLIPENMKLEYEWLEKVNSVAEDTSNITWSSHHALANRGPEFLVSISSLLPLFSEQAHSVATIKHSMDKVKEVVEFLNPGQIPVLTADLPLFAIAKQIQWQWPNVYGEDKFVIILGGLHIEMALLKTLGDLLKESGWTAALAEAGVASSGTAESFLSASNVAKTRLAHQVTACSLYRLLRISFQCREEEHLNFDEWCIQQGNQYPQFRFWNMILNLQMLILMLVRSYREADFQLYIETLRELIPYIFALDHTNYSRWLPVHLKDMMLLKTNHPAIYDQFLQGNFTVHKSQRPFSAIAIDHAHEQNNALVKGDGGAIGLTEDPSALRRWMVAGPEICRLVEQFEGPVENDTLFTDNPKHHEQTQSYQINFLENVDKLTQVLDQMGNPFQEESRDLIVLDTKEIADPSVNEAIANLKMKGQNQFDTFVEGLQSSESSFYLPIKKNKLPLFSRRPSSLDPSASKSKLALMKDDCQLFSRLFISCQSRQCDLNDFFVHENQASPPSLSQNGKIRTGSKSQLMGILEKFVNPPDTEPKADAIIIDGAALVNSRPPGAAKTFNEYASEVIMPVIKSFSQKHSRTDVVFDVYRESSLKAQARSKRGTGIRRKVTGTSRIPSSWNGFLRVDENKTELFSFLACKIVSPVDDSNLIIATCDDDVLSNSALDKSDLAPCSHEEADTRMFVHAMHAGKHGCKDLIVSSTDTDVVVIAISVFPSLEIDNLWIAFGRGKDFRWIPVHEITTSLGPKASALPFFHAFTGCDTVSFFHTKGKKSAWQAWDVFDEATETFSKLSHKPDSIGDDDLSIVEAFTVIMYDRSSPTNKVNEARFIMFARKQKPYDTIPPTQAALLQHIKRSAFQGGHIWGQTLISDPELPSPSNWGWKKEDNQWNPYWTTLPAVASSCQELLKCGCKKRLCIGNCKCYRAGLPCSALCSCNCEID